MNHKPPKLLSNTTTIGSQGNPTAAGKKEQKVEIPTKRKSSRISQLPSPDYTNYEENSEDDSEENYVVVVENYEENYEESLEPQAVEHVSPLADKKRKVVAKKRVSTKKQRDEESLERHTVEQVQTLLSLSPTKRKSSRISQLPSPDYTYEKNYEENSEDNYEQDSEDDSEENYDSDVSPLADKKRKVVAKKRVSGKKQRDEESLEPQAVEQVQTLLSLRGSSSSSSNVATATAAQPRAGGREPKCSCHRQKSECLVHKGS
jgi:hypothetical protein